jgi:hypothetical protein
MRALFSRKIPRRLQQISSRSNASRRALVESLEPRQLLSTYYVSPYGSDSHSGTSSGSAWKSLSRVNKQSLHAGDKVLLQGGATFSGLLWFTASRTGTSSSPITISTYGSGRATIRSGSTPAIDLGQSSGISISNLNLVGSGMYSNSSNGINVHVDRSGTSLSNGLTVNNVDVSGYGNNGISVSVDVSSSSFNNVRITNSTLHDNRRGGFRSGNKTAHGSKNYTLDHVKVWNIPGDRGRSDPTGSGIFLAQVDGGLVTRCVVHDNGKDGAAPVGIWATQSNRITLQYSETYNNHTRTISDGGGFDFDWDVTNSVMQYNFSHNNDGPGFLLAAGTHTSSGNVIRYNVSQNDGRKNGRAGIQIWGNVTNAAIYNNTSYISYGTSNTAAFYAHDSGTNGLEPRNVQIRNNIFYATGGAKVLNLASGVASKGSLSFIGNCYYSGSGSFKIQWGSATYTSLTNWRNSKGQEKLNGAATGYQGDPKLNNAGQSNTLNNADKLNLMSAYRLQSSSPLINRGVSQPTFLSSTSVDFFGGSLPKGGKYDIGVNELR